MSQLKGKSNIYYPNVNRYTTTIRNQQENFFLYSYEYFQHKKYLKKNNIIIEDMFSLAENN